MGSKRVFSREYKLEAVKLVMDRGVAIPIREPSMNPLIIDEQREQKIANPMLLEL